MRKALRKKPPVTQSSSSILEDAALCVKPFPEPRQGTQLCLEAVHDDVQCCLQGMPWGAPCTLLCSPNLISALMALAWAVPFSLWRCKALTWQSLKMLLVFWADWIRHGFRNQLPVSEAQEEPQHWQPLIRHGFSLLGRYRGSSLGCGDAAFSLLLLLWPPQHPVGFCRGA